MKTLLTLFVILLIVLLVMPLSALLLNRVPLMAEPGLLARLQSYFSENQRGTRHDHPYPELRPTCLDTDPERLEKVMQEAAYALGWEKADASDPADGFHWVVTTTLFRFKDDVKAQIRREDCLWLDIQSSSRVGRGDLGANLSHILRFDQEIRRRLSATD